MSIFGFYFVSSLLREMGWPRKQGLFKGQGFDTLVVDATIDQMIDWAAALGAGHPRLALQVIGEMLRDRDWAGDDAPKIKVFVDGAQDTWNRSASVAPHEIVKPIIRVAKFGKSISLKDFKDARLRVALEDGLFEPLLWGLSNPDRFATWYASNLQHNESSLPFMRKAGLVIDPLPPLAQHFRDSEQILRDYEHEVGVLSPIPPQLMSDATALGWKLDK
jgi:hypothetical protein